MTKAQLEKLAAQTLVKPWTEVLQGTDVVVEEPGGELVAYSFAEAIERRISLDEGKKQAEAALKAMNDALLMAMRAAEQQKVGLWEGMTLEVRTGKSPARIEPTKLLEQGVSVDQIAAATVDGKEYQYVQVNKPKAGRA